MIKTDWCIITSVCYSREIKSSKKKRKSYGISPFLVEKVHNSILMFVLLIPTICREIRRKQFGWGGPRAACYCASAIALCVGWNPLEIRSAILSQGRQIWWLPDEFVILLAHQVPLLLFKNKEKKFSVTTIKLRCLISLYLQLVSLVLF